MPHYTVNGQEIYKKISKRSQICHAVRGDATSNVLGDIGLQRIHCFLRFLRRGSQ